MKVIEKYTGEKSYMFPNGELATPAIIQERFPAVEAFVHIVETDESGEVLFAIQNLSAMCSFYGISQSLSEAEKIAEIQEKANEEPEASAPSAEERIAAALEYQNLLSM